ncbi:MAG TPA: hypothetical protein VNA57_01010 [Acidimicrobiales bacterium]|nr:hypothetical protein [Acidimicrobiales bacterium]
MASSAHHDLRFGIQRLGDRDTPTKIASHLREHGVLAKLALDEERRLAARMLTAPAAEKQRLQALRTSLAASTLDEVAGVFGAPEGTTDPAAQVLDLQGRAAHTLGLQARASWIGALERTAPAAATPISPTRAALQSRAARSVAVVLGLVVAALVGMVEALDPTSAWGTRADIVKMFGAAVLLPGLADQVRKVLAGPAPTGS